MAAKQLVFSEDARRRLKALIGTCDCEIGRMPSREERNARR